MKRRLQDEIVFRKSKPRKLPVIRKPLGNGSGRRNGYNSYRSSSVARSPFHRQLAVVQVHYRRLANTPRRNVADLLAKHKGYLTREGAGIEGRRPELFSAEGREPNLDHLPGEPRIYYLMLSPERGEKLDMEAYTKRFMGEVERMLDRKLLWSAAAHHNTEHPHAHITIRGLDATLDRSNPVYLPPDMVRSGMREMARDLATLQLGYRSEREAQDQLRREVTLGRFTSIDRGIKRGMAPEQLIVTAQTDREFARLKFLGKGFGLARRIPGPGKGFELVPSWEQDLREMGQKDDIIKNLFVDHKKQIEPNRLRFYDKGMTVEGVVDHKGLDDENKETVFALVKTKVGDLYYYTGRGAERTNVGDRVRIDKGRLFVIERNKAKSSERGTVTRPERSPKLQRGPELGL